MTKEAMQKLSEILGYSIEEIEQKLGSQISHINLPVDKLSSKIDIIAQNLYSSRLSKKENQNNISNFIFENMSLLVRTDKDINDLFSFYRHTFKFTTGELYKIRTTHLFKTNVTSINNIINHLVINYQLDEEEVIKILKQNPVIITASRETISKNLTYMQKRLGYSKEDFLKIIKSYPRIICKNPASFEDTINGIKSGLKLSDFGDNEIQNQYVMYLISKNLRLLNTDENYITEKMKILNTIGFDRECVLDRPILITVPTETIRAKFILGAVFDVPKLDNGFFINNFKTSYARLMALKEREEFTGNKIRYSKITISKKSFESYIGDTMENLYQRYSVDEETLDALIDKYYEKQQDNPNLPDLVLSQKEVVATVTTNPPAMGVDE